jgi:hypothetical protein
MVAEAVAIEPVLAIKFPASREFSREFFKRGPWEGDYRIKNASII